MHLDDFDRRTLEQRGDAQKIIRNLYGKNLSLNNARKYWSGIRMHVNFKKSISESKDIEELDEVIVKGDGTRTTVRMLRLSEADRMNPSHVMALCGFDPLQWELITCKMRRSYYDVTLKNKHEDGVTSADKNTNHTFMVTLTVKPIQHLVTTDDIIDAFNYLEPPKLEKISHKGGECLLELPIVDLHLGLLTWKHETGEDYDLKIAERLYKDTINDILSRVKSYGLSVDKVLFIIGQDFFNSDTVTNTTTKGTILDSDSRWAKMYTKGVELLVWAVESLRRIAPVHIMHIPGNHDKMLSYCATVTVQSFFRDCKDVYVDISPKPRMYYQYGKCLIGYAHGDTEGKRIKGLMQVEAPQMWGETIYREFHLGHLHHEYVEEDNGIIFRRISAIKSTDAWEVEMGFVGAIHKAQAFVWDKEKGKTLTIDSIQHVRKERDE